MNRWISECFIATGPRGGGKTLLLTVLLCQLLIKARYLGFNVWSNYPVGFFHKDLLSGEIVYLHPKPLNMEAFYVFDKSLAKGWVFIDEIDQWLDRQDWQAATQKLINKVLTLMRHRQLSLGGSIQNFDWLNSRGKFQVDVECSCRDARFSPWGRAIHLQGGEVINLSWKDLSGIKTGYTFAETRRIYHNTLRAKWAHDKYDTYFEFDPQESKTRYRIRTKVKEIDFTGQDGAEVIGEYHSENKDTNESLVADYVYDLIQQGETRIGTGQFHTLLKESGFVGTKIQMRETMGRLGFQRSPNLTHYILDEKERDASPNPPTHKRELAGVR